MAIKRGDTPFIGTRDGICGYMSHGINIIRKSTPLTGVRVKKDPAFEGFRQSGNRMKEASPIAAALYNQIPKEKKEYDLYRLLTGEALKMLKEGMDKTDITDKLQNLYIDPIMQEPAIQKRPKLNVRSNLRTTRRSLFIIYKSGEPNQSRGSFLTKSYQSRTKSIRSPLFNGLGTDLVAYG